MRSSPKNTQRFLYSSIVHVSPSLGRNVKVCERVHLTVFAPTVQRKYFNNPQPKFDWAEKLP